MAENDGSPHRVEIALGHECRTHDEEALQLRVTLSREIVPADVREFCRGFLLHGGNGLSEPGSCGASAVGWDR